MDKYTQHIIDRAKAGDPQVTSNRQMTHAEWLNKFYRHDRLDGRNGREWGENYGDIVRKSHAEDLELLGYDVISRHESNTGEAVWFVNLP